MRTHQSRRIGLVLGGGGLKGFAHLGVLRAIEERGLKPSIYAGSSIGALIAASRVTGRAIDELTRQALTLRRRDLFRINHVGMLLSRLRSESIYQEEGLRALVQRVVPRVRFDELDVPLYINTVDVDRGTQIAWGMPGHRDVYVDDAVYASCALPVFFPPGRVDGRYCIDGGTVDNLPVSLVAREVDVVIAVDVANGIQSPEKNVTAGGFASLSIRAASITMHALQTNLLNQWSGPPLILIRPRVAHVDWFRFDATAELIDAGYQAATHVLRNFDQYAAEPGGIFPRQLVQLTVDRAQCNGCGLCVAAAPKVMALDLQGKAFPLAEANPWSAADGEFIRHCPTGALTVTEVDPVLKKAS